MQFWDLPAPLLEPKQKVIGAFNTERTHVWTLCRPYLSCLFFKSNDPHVRWHGKSRQADTGRLAGASLAKEHMHGWDPLAENETMAQPFHE